MAYRSEFFKRTHRILCINTYGVSSKRKGFTNKDLLEENICGPMISFSFSQVLHIFSLFPFI